MFAVSFAAELGRSQNVPSSLAAPRCRKSRNESRGSVSNRSVLRLILVLPTLFSVMASAQSISELRLNGPAEAMGDGVTPIRIEVTLDPRGPGELEGLNVDVSAGRIAGKKQLATGAVEMTLIPPRVVEAVVLTVKTKSRRGQRGQTEIRLLPAIAQGKVRASNGPLDLQVPERMILGDDRPGFVSFRAGSVSAITLYASSGTISSAQPESADRYRAIYTPPAEKLPRIVVVVAANADGSLVDWAPIQLFGQPILSTTSEPNTTVLARVADAEFGPVKADKSGRVELRVLAPPGVADAKLIARNELGSERIVTLKLGVSSVHESFAICPPAGEALLYFAANASGAARKGLKIQVASSLGNLAPPQLMAGGYYASALTRPPDATSRQSARLAAQIDGEPDSRGVCNLAAPDQAPRAATFKPNDVTLRIGETSEVGRVRIGLTPPSHRFRLWGALGYATNFAKVRAPIGALGGGVRLPLMRARLIVGIDVAYAASQKSELDSTGAELVSIKTTVVPVFARAIYELALSDFSPYLGVGGGLGMVRLDISSPSSGRTAAWKPHPAIAGMAGTLVRLGPGSALVEAAYRYIPVSEPTATGNVGGLSAVGGYLYEF
jgi:hypothetical protein